MKYPTPIRMMIAKIKRNQNQKLDPDLVSVFPLNKSWIDLVLGLPFGPITSKLILLMSAFGSLMVAWKALVFLEAILSVEVVEPPWVRLRSLVPVGAGGVAV